MKILITGASGFIAHHLIQKSKDTGWYVIGVDKRPLPPNHSVPDHFIQTDVRDLKFRDLMNVDYVAHLAFSTNIPSSIRHPVEYTDENIGTFIRLLEVAKECKIKKVFFPSTASLYSNNPTPWTEDMPPQPIEPYSWQKLCGESLCKLYSEIYDVPTIVGRFFQVFGELQREDTALAAFLRLKDRGEPITLTETTAQSTFKSGQRDFVYAGDTANAVITLLKSDYGKGEIFNVSTGQVTAMEQIAEAIGGEVKWIPKRGYEVERHEGDYSKIKQLGWLPQMKVLTWLNLYANNKK